MPPLSTGLSPNTEFVFIVVANSVGVGDGFEVCSVADSGNSGTIPGGRMENVKLLEEAIWSTFFRAQICRGRLKGNENYRVVSCSLDRPRTAAEQDRPPQRQ